MNSGAFSTNRLPGDNFLSGALVGFIGGGALSLSEFKSGSIDKKAALKKTLKFGLNGAFATGFAISASNNIVRKNYGAAIGDLAVGLALIAITNNVIKEN